MSDREKQRRALRGRRMLAALASDSGSAGRAAQPAMPRADAQPRPRRCATARSHGVSPESVISRGRIARLMLPRFAAVNFQQGLKPRHARGHPASRIARIYPWFCSQFPPAGPPPAQAQSRRFVTAQAILLMAGSKHCEGTRLQPTRQEVTHGLSDGVLRMGLLPAAETREWPPNIATRLCSKQHAIRREHHGRGAFRLGAPVKLRQI